GPGRRCVTARSRARVTSAPRTPAVERTPLRAADLVTRGPGGADEGKARTATSRHGSADRALAPARVPCRVSGGSFALRCVLRAAPAVASMTMIEDRTMTALHSALTGLSERQRVTADNIANINTPGFLAGRTDFESA